jgi:hypothetical protein
MQGAWGIVAPNKFKDSLTASSVIIAVSRTCHEGGKNPRISAIATMLWTEHYVTMIRRAAPRELVNMTAIPYLEELRRFKDSVREICVKNWELFLGCGHGISRDWRAKLCLKGSTCAKMEVPAAKW